MLEHTQTTVMWETLFKSKFASFCKKSPVLLSMLIKIQDGEKGVLVTHLNTSTKYFFPFDYDQNVKDFIAEIKKFLVEKHYPRIIEEILEKHEKTNEELAKEIEDSGEVEGLKKYCMQLVGTRQYRIDKVLPWKNIAILVLEGSDIKTDEVGSSYRYKYDKSLVLYLKNYRTGKYSSITEASNEFFNNSMLIEQLGKNKEEKNA